MLIWSIINAWVSTLVSLGMFNSDYAGVLD
jgi:hypothetical protein